MELVPGVAQWIGPSAGTPGLINADSALRSDAAYLLRLMRVGEADHASPPSQTGRALLTHPAFRSAVWQRRPTCGENRPWADRRAAPATAVLLLWTQFPEPSIGLGLI